MPSLSNQEPSSSPSADRPVRVALLGFGTVGSGTYRMVKDNQEEIARKTGLAMEIVKIGIKDETKKRSLPSSLFTTDLDELVVSDEIDVVVELIGGEEPAAGLVEKALLAKKHVVTANKELIAKHGSRLITLAKDSGLDLHFEAAVGGGIPVVQPLKHQLAGNDVIKMMGILNGTTNYILTQMATHGADFADALAEAQQKGYAEADPTNDVDGIDTMYKTAILAAITFGKQVPLEQIHREGIRKVSYADIHAAQMLGYVIKLLGIVEETKEGVIMVRVHPALIPQTHQLASVNDVYNAIWLKGDFVGDLMFSGRGAGADPTASAVVGDLIDVARNIKMQGSGSAIPYGQDMPTSPIEELESRYYLRLTVEDTAGTLGQIATAFGRREVGLAAMEMRTKVGGLGEIVFLTHVCRELDFVQAIGEVGRLGCIVSVNNWLRVEG